MHLRHDECQINMFCIDTLDKRERVSNVFYSYFAVFCDVSGWHAKKHSKVCQRIQRIKRRAFTCTSQSKRSKEAKESSQSLVKEVKAKPGKEYTSSGLQQAHSRDGGMLQSSKRCSRESKVKTHGVAHWKCPKESNPESPERVGHIKSRKIDPSRVNATSLEVCGPRLWWLLGP